MVINIEVYAHQPLVCYVQEPFLSLMHFWDKVAMNQFYLGMCGAEFSHRLLIATGQLLVQALAHMLIMLRFSVKVLS